MKILAMLWTLLCLSVAAYAQRPAPDQIETNNGPLTIQPIHHATLVLSWNGNTIYVDPTGGGTAFEGIKAPDLILITHTHGDHLDPDTIGELDTGDAIMVVPQTVADKLPDRYSSHVVVIGNGEQTKKAGIEVRAVPMYNLPQNEKAHHIKGEGNGYVLTMGGKNIYLSGDTEDIPEMRSLKNIDVAFVCMNLPYTMDIHQAADAVLDFKPAIVYPYHYRGQDTEAFKKLVEAKSDEIEVRLRNWYAN